MLQYNKDEKMPVVMQLLEFRFEHLTTSTE